MDTIVKMLPRKRITPVFIAFAVVLMVAAMACGSEESTDVAFAQISDPGKIFTLDDLLATSFKQSSNYSTEGLPGATDVSYGFLRVGDRDPYDYEVRFYESHQVAIDQGIPFAIEGTGANAVLSADDAKYKEGVKNRRTIIGGGTGGGARSGIGPKFASYAVFGNIVMLCQGSDAETSIERCGLLANTLAPRE